MADDQPARIELMKLKAIITILGDAFASLDYKVNTLWTTSNILIAETVTELSTKDASLKKFVALKHNADGSFGFYFPEVTTDPVDGVNVVTDINGKTFVLLQ